MKILYVVIWGFLVASPLRGSRLDDVFDYCIEGFKYTNIMELEYIEESDCSDSESIAVMEKGRSFVYVLESLRNNDKNDIETRTLKMNILLYLLNGFVAHDYSEMTFAKSMMKELADGGKIEQLDGALRGEYIEHSEYVELLEANIKKCKRYIQRVQLEY